MTKTPIVTAKLMVKYLKNLGFIQTRQKGSHKFFRHSDGRTATIPDHKGEDLGSGITSKILKDIEVTKADFMHWYQKQ